MSILLILFIVFLILKLAGIVAFTWIQVVAPLLGVLAIAFILAVFELIEKGIDYYD